MAEIPGDSAHVDLTSEKFEDLELDSRAKKVLKSKGYVYLTHVQSKVLPLALQGKNLVIQSPTGSGKTLCFLLPAVKLLYEEGYSGNLPSYVNLLGCICLAPTRELASQSAIQMNDLAAPLKLNAGCCIGGIRDKYDKSHASRLHILTGTPGRVLALLTSKALQDTSNVKIFVLDEADRLLDSGFKDTILEIVNLLPPDIQILLFSATIKSSLKELCNLVLRNVDYEYVCCGSDASVLMESSIRQEFVVLPQELKLAALFQILCKHQGKRILVFLPTCKHVRFVYEVFKRMIPAIAMSELHGKQSQLKRMEQFTRFASKDKAGCIFTTDVAARGIDFPILDLIIQMDLPDSVETYTHRVGRTGRLTIDGTRGFGRTLLFVQEAEVSFIEKLRSTGIKLYDQTKLLAPLVAKKREYVLSKLQSILAKESWIKEMAQRSIVAYLRYMTTRRVVQVPDEVLVETIKQFALAMGLPSAPDIKVASKVDKKPSAKTSKLAKLKQKIKDAKRAKQMAPPEALEEIQQTEEDPNTESDADEDSNAMQESETASEDESFDSESEADDLLVAGGNVADDLEKFEKWKATTQDPNKDIQMALASTRKRLRINRHGVAKLRGLVTIKEAEARHTVFSDEEDDDTVDTVDSKREEEADNDASVNVTNGKMEYIDKLKEQMKSVQQQDKIHETLRIQEKHARKKQKT